MASSIGSDRTAVILIADEPAVGVVGFSAVTLTSKLALMERLWRGITGR